MNWIFVIVAVYVQVALVILCYMWLELYSNYMLHGKRRTWEDIFMCLACALIWPLGTVDMCLMATFKDRYDQADRGED